MFNNLCEFRYRTVHYFIALLVFELEENYWRRAFFYETLSWKLNAEDSQLSSLRGWVDCTIWEEQRSHKWVLHLNFSSVFTFEVSPTSVLLSLLPESITQIHINRASNNKKFQFEPKKKLMSKKKGARGLLEGTLWDMRLSWWGDALLEKEWY